MVFSIIGILLQMLSSTILILRKCITPLSKQLKARKEKEGGVENDVLIMPSAPFTEVELRREVSISRVSLGVLILGSIMLIIGILFD